MMNRATRSLIGLVLALALLAVGCSKPNEAPQSGQSPDQSQQQSQGKPETQAPAPAPSEPAPTKLDFGGSATWYGHAPIMVAVEKGFFKDQGLEVEYQIILSSSDRLNALTSGSVAFTNLGRLAIISGMAQGNDSFYYFANIDDSPGNEGMWARAGINNVEDLRGKKVAANTSAEILLHEILADHGMSIKDVEFVNIPANEMALALKNGSVDAIVVWEPVLSDVKKAVPDGKLLATDTDVSNYGKFKTASAPDIVIISRKLVDEHPEQARKLATAIFQGVALVNEHPEEAAQLIAHYFKKTPEEVLAGMKKFQYFGLEVQGDHMKRHEAQMDFLAGWLAEMGKVPNKPDISKWANYSFLPDKLPQ